jgi:hypothetical protein
MTQQHKNGDTSPDRVANGDIVERLRKWFHDVNAVSAIDVMDEAANEIERLRNGAAEARETVCPHVRGTVTQHCSLNFTLSDEERAAVEWFAEVRKPLTRLTQSHNREKYKDTLCGLLERLK